MSETAGLRDFLSLCSAQTKTFVRNALRRGDVEAVMRYVRPDPQDAAWFRDQLSRSARPAATSSTLLPNGYEAIVGRKVSDR